jgi:DNA-binding NarL/FixJ family response regulator
MSMRVLITDERVTFREFLKSFLSTIPEFQVAGKASDGPEAVKLVARLKPELVLMDIEMPRMDELEAARCIKAHNDGTSAIPLSALADEVHRQAADASRPDAFLSTDGRMGHALAMSQGMECSSQAPSCWDSLVKDGSGQD